MRIIAYTWEAELHCVPCTQRRFPPDDTHRDEHDVLLAATDQEGNPAHPVFSTDSFDENLYCNDCRDEILIIAG